MYADYRTVAGYLAGCVGWWTRPNWCRRHCAGRMRQVYTLYTDCSSVLWRPPGWPVIVGTAGCRRRDYWGDLKRYFHFSGQTERSCEGAATSWQSDPIWSEVIVYFEESREFDISQGKQPEGKNRRNWLETQNCLLAKPRGLLRSWPTAMLWIPILASLYILFSIASNASPVRREICWLQCSDIPVCLPCWSVITLSTSAGRDLFQDRAVWGEYWSTSSNIFIYIFNKLEVWVAQPSLVFPNSTKEAPGLHQSGWRYSLLTIYFSWILMWSSLASDIGF